MKILFWIMAWIISIFLFAYAILNFDTSPIHILVKLISTSLIVIFGIVSFIIPILEIEDIARKKYPIIIGSFLTMIVFLCYLGFSIRIITFAFSIIPKPQIKEVKVKEAGYILLQSPLKLGSSGEDVTLLQAVLHDTSFYPSGIVNGYYGPLTKEAVTNFQKGKEIAQTGEMNNTTINKFNQTYGYQPKSYYLAKIPTNTSTSTNPAVKTTTQTNIDSDPIVNCLIHEKCGGGSTKVKKSICDNSICCFYSDRNVFYLDKSQCNSSNDATNNNTSGTTTINYTFPTAIPQNNTTQNIATQPTTIPQPKPTIDNTSVREQCKKDAAVAWNTARLQLQRIAVAQGWGGGSDYQNEQANLKNAQIDKIAQCNSMYP